MKTLLLSSVIFILSTFAYAQNHTISGKMTENETPIPGVSIVDQNTQKFTVSDSLGNYNLQLPEGQHTLLFSYGIQVSKTIHLTENEILNIEWTEHQETLDQIIISNLRVDDASPVTHTNLDNQQIKERNLGQDIPVLMQYLPNVTTTSDAGAGIGHTGIRVRGSDATRVNVSINGIPLNDQESQGTFWVNLGDFTSSTEDIQLQRGVGTSTNGSGAFGASLNVKTTTLEENAAAKIMNTYGSFNTHKHQIDFHTGKVNDNFYFSGNFSLSKSDGYRDRSYSDLKSYFLQGVYKKENTLIKALSFGGSQETYQAYWGITKEQLQENRKFNPAGIYEDDEGNTLFYDQQTDNYKQDHLQFIWSQQYNTNWSSTLAFHYTYGRGFYESYIPEAFLTDYNLTPFEYEGEIREQSDIVNQKWLNNDFLGSVFDLNYKQSGFKFTIGGGWNYYSGDHYGKVMYAKFAQLEKPYQHYYDNKGKKFDANAYLKTTYALTDNLSIYTDLQYRHLSYKTEGPYEGEDFDTKDHFNFFNPKAGLTYEVNSKNQLYFSYGRANKEPNRSDYKGVVLGVENPVYPKAEQLDDYELGWRLKDKKVELNSNLYWMNYHNQLVLTGKIDNEGRFIRENSGKSYRLGLEIDAAIQLHSKLSIHPNMALSTNKNKDFQSLVDNEMRNFGNTKISFSPQIVAGNLIRYSPVPNLQINFMSKYIDSQYMSNLETKDSKLSSYFLNDLNIQYAWKNAPVFREIVFTGMLNNIFDKKYISNGYYALETGPEYYPQAGINFLTGITLKF